MKKRYRCVSLGCRTNQYESQVFSDQLEGVGFNLAKNNENVDLLVVNTCCVTENASKDSKNKIRSLRKKYPKAQIYLTGCLTNTKEDFSSFGENIFITKKEDLIKKICPRNEKLPKFSIKRFIGRTRAIVKVQDGCNSYCSYCIIPFVRGRSRSRKTEEIIDEINVLVKNGYKEVVLTGINIGDFSDNKRSLADLIRKIDEIKGIERIRISSIDPDDIDDDLVEAILFSKNTTDSMHIVLQSASNKILERMNRKYSKEKFISVIEKFNKKNPKFTFTTDVIVGFPGEGEEDFNETLNMIKHVGFIKAHVFPYSIRSNTKASRMKDHVEMNEIKRRKKEILELSNQIAFNRRQSFIGDKVKVLLENEVNHDEKKYFFSFSSNLLPILVLEDKNLSRNDLVDVKIIENTDEFLIGSIL